MLECKAQPASPCANIACIWPVPLVHLAIFEPQPPPGSTLPEACANCCLRVQQRSVAGCWLRRQDVRWRVLDDLSRFDHHDPRKALGLANVVGNTQERGVLPVPAHVGQQPLACGPIEPPKRFVEHYQTYTGTQQCPPQAHALPLAP